jgi:type IV pilus assembly protein PilC
VMVCFVCLAVAIILPPLCLRSMLAMLRDSGVALPWPTKVLMAVSALSSSIWFYLGLVFLAVGGWFAWRKAMENQEIRRSFWQLLLSVPVLSDLLIMIGVIRFGQTFSSLLDSGHNLLATVNLAAQSSGDPVLEANIPKAIERLKEGESLASSLAAAEYFPRSFLQSLKAGEEAGSPSQIVNSMLSMYHVDLDYRLTVFTNSLEPLFMLAIGAVVGFVSVAALLPMLKLVETL